MMYWQPRTLSAIAAGFTLASSLLTVGCRQEGPSGPSVTDIRLAKGGGGGGGKGPNVDSTDPASAPQDITLDVTVSGSGFDDGSVVTFTIDGTPQPTFRTNNTEFVNESELVTNVTIDADAIVELYDVEVVTFRGKKGVGADLFSVLGSSRGGNGGGSGAGGTGTFDLTMEDGLVGTALGIDLLDDRKQSIWAPFDGMVWNAVLTQAAAEQERTNPGLDDVCEFSQGISDADKQELIRWFTAGNVSGSMAVKKREGRGHILAGPDGVWMSLGKDNDTIGQEDARAYVASSGTDWNDVSSTRVFVFSGGRFVLGLPDAWLKCENQGDVVVATLAPAN